MTNKLNFDTFDPLPGQGGRDFMRYARAGRPCGAVLGASAGERGSRAAHASGGALVGYPPSTRNYFHFFSRGGLKDIQKRFTIKGNR